ncbi:regulatory protein, luxR family [Saccharopolyspora kobensis]|uniref:Regulatory protein, luxR family n=1 Tax=Saccharopolyspora kobensis TaxID=146035 RepID=A0A1H6EJ55_9PSEU|nr:helix-turn-helix transcriptional regulator [Saccharopolyspora kobensis]SEG97910.1 regulatory protein, luxR family [Saccharopolyspora kobensis]SFF23705.1 regulatory protein, luxR family [Saccharopolyspora kobensis]
MSDSAVDPVLRGRERESAVLRGLLAQRGGALVITGAAGAGKSALLDHVRRIATGFRTAHVGGVRPEREIPLAALDRLLRSAGHRLAADERAEEALFARTQGGPLLCCVDDVSELDSDSLRVLAFAGRRADSEEVLLVFAADPVTADGQLIGIPQLRIAELDAETGRQLLADRFGPALAPVVVDEILRRAGGNPRALVEAATALSAEQRAGLEPVPQLLPHNSRLRARLRCAAHDLPEPASTVIARAAAAEHDLAAAGFPADGLAEAERSGLVVVVGDRVRMPNEFAKSCLRADLSPELLREAHRHLARTTTDPVQIAWHEHEAGDRDIGDLPAHLARAARSARRAGHHAAAADVAAKAAELAADPQQRAQHLLAAGRDAQLSGQPRRALALIDRARSLPASAQWRGVADFVFGEVALRDGMPDAAHHDLLRAADRLISTDRPLAVTALALAAEANCVSGDHERLFAVAARAEQLRSPDDGPAEALIFEHVRGMAATFRGRHAVAVPALRRVLALVDQQEAVISRILASQAAFALGDPVRAHDSAHRAVAAAKDCGETAHLPWALVYLVLSALLLDRYDDAENGALEGLRVARATDQRNIAIDHLSLLALAAALRGDHETACGRLDAAFGDGVASRGLGRPGAFGMWALGCAELASGRSADAVRRLCSAAPGSGRINPVVRVLAAPHLVESAVDCGEGARVRRTLEAFDDWAGTTGSRTRLALSHRCHALIAETGADADERFRTAIELHRSSGAAVELARTELLYAKRLRRRRKPRQARELLSEAYAIFEQFGANSWAEQAGAELRAAGVSTPRRPPAPGEGLTPQQAEICRLVAEGATNREIAERLYISHRTVDHHLRNIFTKLGVRSRVQLAKLVS